jgi:hypothetical protein
MFAMFNRRSLSLAGQNNGLMGRRRWLEPAQAFESS